MLVGDGHHHFVVVFAGKDIEVSHIGCIPIIFVVSIIVVGLIIPFKIGDSGGGFVLAIHMMPFARRPFNPNEHAACFAVHSLHVEFAMHLHCFFIIDGNIMFEPHFADFGCGSRKGNSGKHCQHTECKNFPFHIPSLFFFVSNIGKHDGRSIAIFVDIELHHAPVAFIAVAHNVCRPFGIGVPYHHALHGIGLG